PWSGPIALAVCIVASIIFAPVARAQNQQSATAAKASKPGPAPRRDLSGLWTPNDGPGAAIQAGGVAAVPNDGKPEHALPYTPYGLELYKSHKALEGADMVLPAFFNDPRVKCEPLGFPRINHYNVRMTQIFQNPYRVAILYEYDRRWRDIFVDGRELPKVVDGGVMTGSTYKEQKWYGYSVGSWTDDYTLKVQTVGTTSEDRVWLDSTGRPISDAAIVEEVFRRVDSDHLEWTETINDPKVYTKPW